MLKFCINLEIVQDGRFHMKQVHMKQNRTQETGSTYEVH